MVGRRTQAVADPALAGGASGSVIVVGIIEDLLPVAFTTEGRDALETHDDVVVDEEPVGGAALGVVLVGQPRVDVVLFESEDTRSASDGDARVDGDVHISDGGDDHYVGGPRLITEVHGIREVVERHILRITGLEDHLGDAHESAQRRRVAVESEPFGRRL